MSELNTSLGQQLPEGQLNGQNDEGLATAGALLRAARESTGLHIAALAVALKVPVKKLEALEADRYDLLPDAVFTRALASSVCRTLKMDAAPVLERLPQKSGSQLSQAGGGINAPFRDSNDGPRPSALAQVSRPAMLAGIALLLAALVLIFLPALKAGMEDAKSSLTDIVAADVPGAAPISPAAQNDALDSNKAIVEISGSTAPLPVSGESAALVLPANTAANSAASVVASTSVASPSSVSGTLAATAPLTGSGTAAQEAASGILVFTAKSTSWVEVTDASRQVVLRRTLSAGESAGANGALPLSVIVGRADATDVHVRGKPFELATFSKSNVARFEVK